MARISKATKRDIETAKDAIRDFVRELRNPVTLACFAVATAVIVTLVAGSFLMDAEELPW